MNIELPFIKFNLANNMRMDVNIKLHFMTHNTSIYNLKSVKQNLRNRKQPPLQHLYHDLTHTGEICINSKDQNP